MRRLLRARRQRGQAIMEFAWTFPFFFLLVMASIEFGLIFVAYFSETRMARETARWLAIRSETTDDATLASHVQSTMLPLMINGTPTQVTAGTESVDAVWKVGNMTVTFTPCVMSSGVCGHPDRASGSTLYVELEYDVSNLPFLPTQFNMGVFNLTLPTGLPPYRVYIMTE